MKKVIRAAAFLVFLAVVLSGVGRVMLPQNNRYLSGYKSGGVFGETEGTIDVLSLGNSNTAQGVSPMEWWNAAGIAGYNYGEAWLDVYGAYYALDNILEEQTPQLLLLETDILFSERIPDADLENMLTAVSNHHLPVTKYHNEWKTIDLFNQLTPLDWYWSDTAKGLEIVVKKSPCKKSLDYMQENPGDDAELSWEQKLYLTKILNRCEQIGCKVVLFSVPSVGTCNLTRHNVAAEWAAENEVPYYDLNLTIGQSKENWDQFTIDWSIDTADGGDHLNISGARKVTGWLLDNVLCNYDLPDRRGEAAWSDWNADWQEYLGEVSYKENEWNAQQAAEGQTA